MFEVESYSISTQLGLWNHVSYIFNTPHSSHNYTDNDIFIHMLNLSMTSLFSIDLDQCEKTWCVWSCQPNPCPLPRVTCLLHIKDSEWPSKALGANAVYFNHSLEVLVILWSSLYGETTVLQEMSLVFKMKEQPRLRCWGASATSQLWMTDDVLLYWLYFYGAPDFVIITSYTVFFVLNAYFMVSAITLLS